MPTPFAALEARVSQACLRAGANATATLPLGGVVNGVLVEAPTEAELFGTGMASRQLSFHCLAVDVTEQISRGAAITVDGKAYAVAEVQAFGAELHWQLEKR